MATDALMVLAKTAKSLSLITSLPELLDIRSKAEAVRSYVKCQGDGLLAQNQAARIKAMAERRIGELVREMQADGTLEKRGGDKKSNSQAASLIRIADLGIDHSQSSRFQRQAGLSQEQFDLLVTECNAAGTELTQALIIRAAGIVSKIEDAEKDETEPEPPGLYECIAQLRGYVVKMFDRWPEDELPALSGKLRCLADEIDAGEFQGREDDN